MILHITIKQGVIIILFTLEFGENTFVSFIKNIENEYQISLLDRLDISFRDKNKISVLRLDDFKRKILEKKINNDTIVFNNLINLKSDLTDNWEIPLNRSWHQKLIK